MKRFFALTFFCAALYGCGNNGKEQPFKMIAPVDFSHVKITDHFWAPRLKSHASTTLAVCIDQIEHQTGRIRNFENAARGEGEHSGIFFDDSDVYKALEGIAYTLQNNPDPELEKKADEWIDKFAAAQQPDGYINTFYTLTGLEKRWQNMDKHEMY
ncbi:MAG: glycoside hydrolase family 127 protein, partial [Bacteroidales bacterium]|nr:glycoside hydrolase family 127 protein [Bacteroidales bacterium]